LSAYSKICKNHDTVIVEGVGGLMVPLRRDLLLADLLARVRIPTIIVARSGLGTLNQTLLTIEALRTRDIPIIGLLFTDSADEDEIIATDNMRTIAESGRVEVLGRLPYCQNHRDLIDHFSEIGSRLLPLFSS
jgi:dethiobiotin synthetase